MTLLLAAGTALAHEPSSPSGKVSPSEYREWNQATTIQAGFVADQLQIMQSQVSQCSDESSGGAESKQAWKETMENFVRLYDERASGLTSLIDWTGGLAARADAYRRPADQERVRTAGNDLHSGAAKLKDTLLELEVMAADLSAFRCDQTDRLNKATLWAGSAGGKFKTGFDELHAAVTSEP